MKNQINCKKTNKNRQNNELDKPLMPQRVYYFVNEA